MKCNTCGRQTQNEEANFCEYCGSSFRERPQTSYHMSQSETANQQMNQHNDGAAVTSGNAVNATQNAKDKPVSFLNWLGTYGLMLIPLAGGLIFFVMLFVWSFDNKTPESKKNWARVTLIFSTVLILFIIGYIVVVMSSPMFRDMMNGTFDYNTYFESINEGNLYK